MIPAHFIEQTTSKQAEVNPFALIDRLLTHQIPYRFLEGQDHWYLGIEERTKITIAPHLNTVALLGKIIHQTRDTIDAGVPLWYFQSPFDPSHPFDVVLPEITIYGNLNESKATLASFGRGQDSNRFFKEILRLCEQSPVDLTPGDPTPLISQEPKVNLEQFALDFDQAMAAIASDELQKLVLSQRAAAPITKHYQRSKALRAIKATHLNSHAFDFPEYFGASPELVLSLRSQLATSRPLAGTRRSDHQGELMDSAKDTQEHAFVVDHIVDRLQQLSSEVMSKGPEVYDVGDLTHLRSEIAALVPKVVNLLDLALAVSPTPAISGAPTKQAISKIAEIEHQGRGAYGGLTGVMFADGDGDAYLTIRAIKTDDHNVIFQGGVGLVQASAMTDEFDEVSSKIASLAKPLLHPTW